MAKGRDGNEASDHWKTPQWLYDELNKEFNFDFDPCPLNHDISLWDGLMVEWGKRNYCNPEYNRIVKPKFIEKAIVEWKKGKLVVLLIPASTSTRQFHKYFWDNKNCRSRPEVEIRFFEGRIAFEGYSSTGEWTNKNVGKHDSMLIILNP